MAGSFKGWSFSYAFWTSSDSYDAGPARLMLEGGSDTAELTVGSDAIDISQDGAQVTLRWTDQSPSSTTSLTAVDSLTLDVDEASVIALQWGEDNSALTYLLYQRSPSGDASAVGGYTVTYIYLDGDMIEDSDLWPYPVTGIREFVDAGTIVASDRFAPGTTIQLDSLSGYLDDSALPTASEGDDLIQLVPLMEPFDAFGGDDTVIGSDRGDNAGGGAGNDSLAGRAGDDILTGGAGNDSLWGEEGDDRLFGGDGDDLLVGGVGNDTLSEATDAHGQPAYWTGNDTYLGGEGDDVILVGAGADSADGGAGNDTITVDYYGVEAGDDHTLQGGEGDDHFVLSRGAGIAMGGAGNDHFTLHRTTYRIEGGEGEDTLRVSEFDLSLNPQADDRLISGIEHLEGLQQSDNRLTGDEAANRITGGYRDDTLIGNGGSDTILGDRGDDSLLGGAGDDVLDGGRGNDTLRGGDGADFITGDSGVDAGTNADVIDGGAGNDTIYGGIAEPVWHYDGSDTIYAGAGDDFAFGGYGNDLIYGGTGNDTLEGAAGSDTLIGESGNDLIAGGAIGDVLFGGDGDDFLNGGFGHDRLNGGAGADRFYHAGVLGHGSDWVQDYDAAEGDVLVVDPTAIRANYQVNFAETAGAGQAGVAEAFVIYRPTGQVLWALVDGAAQDQILLSIDQVHYDLLG